MRVWRVRAEKRAPRGDGPVLAARPVDGATHYQLHTGLHRDAYAAEREAFRSPLRRALFWPAMRFNAARRSILRTEARLIAGETALMVFSESLRAALVDRLHVAPGRVTLERPGIDRDRFSPPCGPTRSGGEGAPALLFVAHNFELKGLRTLFAALELALPDFRPGLTVVGGGPISRFRRLAARSGIAGSVRFTGTLEGASVAVLYRRHDALVHPTFYDPFPLVVVEALASGLPVVTTRRCGASEVAAPGGAAFLIDDPRDAPALLAALRRLAEPAVRREMSGAAIRAAAPLSRREHFERVGRWLGFRP